MKIEDYKEISNSVQVPDKVLAAYESAMEEIRGNAVIVKKKKNTGWKSLTTLSKVAILVGAVLVLSGGTFLTVKAYISHRERLKNMSNEEIIDLYETVFQYDDVFFSREVPEEELEKYSQLYELYCKDMAEPEGQVQIISTKEEYSGEGLAFCKEDHILYIPQRTLTEEEILQLVEYSFLKKYVDYEAYVKAGNPDYYLNHLEQMTDEEVDEFYRVYRTANTEVGFFWSRELSFEELERKSALKKVYKNSGRLPEQPMPLIQTDEEYTGEGVAFCIDSCKFYFPERALTDEELLQCIDFEIKKDYTFNRIKEEIDSGIRSDWPHVDFVEKDKIITLDPDAEVDMVVTEQPWFEAYKDVIEKEFQRLVASYGEEEALNYYANVCFIYLNDDDIPELLFNRGYIPHDGTVDCNVRDYLYTYKDVEVVQLTPGEEVIDDFYGYQKPFSYVERKGMVYCDYYYLYGFSQMDEATGLLDSIMDDMSRMDTWDFETMTFTSSNANIKMLHALYDYGVEAYEDARFSYEYYVNVSEIIRDGITGEYEIVGEKVDEETYEEYEKALWKGEQVTTLQVEDFDKIYLEDDLEKALAQCLSK